jgi:hypothetical protein
MPQKKNATQRTEQRENRVQKIKKTAMEKGELGLLFRVLGFRVFLFSSTWSILTYITTADHAGLCKDEPDMSAC